MQRIAEENDTGPKTAPLDCLIDNGSSLLASLLSLNEIDTVIRAKARNLGRLLSERRFVVSVIF